MSNEESMKASNKGELSNLPSISSSRKIVQTCLHKINATSLTLGKLCNDDFDSLVSKCKITFYHENTRNPAMKANRGKKLAYMQ